MSFFHGLNPTDCSSSVHNPFIQNRPELKDMKQQEVIARNWKILVETKMHILERAVNIICLTFDSIIGDHFLPIERLITAHYIYYRGSRSVKEFVLAYQLGERVAPSYKGILDYLIFPLIARKLFGNQIEEYYAKNPAERSAGLPLGDIMFSTLFSRNFLVFFIVLPLEVTRFTAAVALTLLLAPLVAIACALQLLGNALFNNDAREEASASPDNLTLQPPTR
jgi:hypothetical protein